MPDGVLIGPDGRARCGWVGDDAQYRAYHDEEWGTPLRTDRALFEKLALEGFQAGLSWITILRKRENFRRAFDGFDPAVVARYGERDIERLMADAGIVRNRAKIQATVTNAALVAAMQPGAFASLLWSAAPPPRTTAPAAAEVPATTAQSHALSTLLRGKGFRFVGPTTMYALMQSTGMVNDHVRGCEQAVDATR